MSETLLRDQIGRRDRARSLLRGPGGSRSHPNRVKPKQLLHHGPAYTSKYPPPVLGSHWEKEEDLRISSNNCKHAEYTKLSFAWSMTRNGPDHLVLTCAEEGEARCPVRVEAKRAQAPETGWRVSALELHHSHKIAAPGNTGQQPAAAPAASAIRVLPGTPSVFVPFASSSKPAQTSVAKPNIVTQSSRTDMSIVVPASLPALTKSIYAPIVGPVSAASMSAGTSAITGGQPTPAKKLSYGLKAPSSAPPTSTTVSASSSDSVVPNKTKRPRSPALEAGPGAAKKARSDSDDDVKPVVSPVSTSDEEMLAQFAADYLAKQRNVSFTSSDLIDAMLKEKVLVSFGLAVWESEDAQPEARQHTSQDWTNALAFSRNVQERMVQRQRGPIGPLNSKDGTATHPIDLDSDDDETAPVVASKPPTASPKPAMPSTSTLPPVASTLLSITGPPKPASLPSVPVAAPRPKPKPLTQRKSLPGIPGARPAPVLLAPTGKVPPPPSRPAFPATWNPGEPFSDEERKCLARMVVAVRADFASLPALCRALSQTKSHGPKRSPLAYALEWGTRSSGSDITGYILKETDQLHQSERDHIISKLRQFRLLGDKMAARLTAAEIHLLFADDPPPEPQANAASKVTIPAKAPAQSAAARPPPSREASGASIASVAAPTPPASAKTEVIEQPFTSEERRWLAKRVVFERADFNTLPELCTAMSKANVQSPYPTRDGFAICYHWATRSAGKEITTFVLEEMRSLPQSAQEQIKSNLRKFRLLDAQGPTRLSQAEWRALWKSDKAAKTTEQPSSAEGKASNPLIIKLPARPVENAMPVSSVPSTPITAAAAEQPIVSPATVTPNDKDAQTEAKMSVPMDADPPSGPGPSAPQMSPRHVAPLPPEAPAVAPMGEARTEEEVKDAQSRPRLTRSESSSLPEAALPAAPPPVSSSNSKNIRHEEKVHFAKQAVLKFSKARTIRALCNEITDDKDYPFARSAGAWYLHWATRESGRALTLLVLEEGRTLHVEKQAALKAQLIDFGLLSLDGATALVPKPDKDKNKPKAPAPAHVLLSYLSSRSETLDSKTAPAQASPAPTTAPAAAVSPDKAVNLSALRATITLLNDFSDAGVEPVLLAALPDKLYALGVKTIESAKALTLDELSILLQHCGVPAEAARTLLIPFKLPNLATLDVPECDGSIDHVLSALHPTLAGLAERIFGGNLTTAEELKGWTALHLQTLCDLAQTTTLERVILVHRVGRLQAVL